MKRFLLFLLVIPGSLVGQNLFTLEIRSAQPGEIVSKLNYKKSFVSKKERDKEIQRVLFTLYDNSYLTACIDSIASPLPVRQAGPAPSPKGEGGVIVHINPGSSYQWASLRKGNVDEGILSEAGFREKFYREKPFSYKEVRKVQEKILIWCENNGYPFASVKLDSVQIKGTTLSAALDLQKNNLIKIDSVVNRGNATISDVFLQSCLSLKNGDLYNESLIKKISIRIKELPFVKERIPFRVLFTEDKTKIELFLEKKRASQFDGIVGMLPDNKTGKIHFTGDVRLKLHNSFNRGELLELNWRRLQIATQDLKMRFIFPFIFKSPFGPDASFKLYKKDTTYLEVNPGFGIQYHLSGGNYFKAFVNQRQLSLINTKGLENLTTLPPYADITSTLYGLSLKSEKLDYRLNPRKGYSIVASAAAGNKTIKKNEKTDDAVYTGLKLNSVQYQGEILAEVFFPLMNRSAIKFGANCAYLHNSTLFRNELFRMGGLKTLRGFDEESIFASQYFIFTLEYRFILEENSYLYFFTDGGYYENHSIAYSGDRYDAPYGFGTGISFETKAGIFSISYALGKQFDNPVSFRGGKVHFGIVNYF